MSRWGNWLKRSTLVMLGAVLIGSSAGIPAMASEPSSETGEQTDKTRITVLSFTGLRNEEMVRHVEPGCAEEEVLSQLPSELEAMVIVRTPQDTSQNNPAEIPDNSSDVSDVQEGQEQGAAESTEGQDADEQTADTAGNADNANNTVKAPGSSQAIMEAGENHVLTPVSMMVPVTWKLDAADSYSSSGTFDSTEGTQYAYVPVLADSDGSGNVYTAEATLYKDAAKIPSMHVLVLNQAVGEDSPANDVAPAVDGNNNSRATGNDYIEDTTHGIRIYAETSEGRSIGNVDLAADNNFTIKGGGTYSVHGTWEPQKVLMAR